MGRLLNLYKLLLAHETFTLESWNRPLVGISLLLKLCDASYYSGLVSSCGSESLISDKSSVANRR